METLASVKLLEAKKLFGKDYPRVSPTAFIKDMAAIGLLKQYNKPEDEYKQAVKDLCRNGATWLGGKLYNLGYDVIVHKGKFGGGEHCWVEYNGYFLDLTAIQFSQVFPKFTVIRASEATGYPLYEVEEALPFPKWEQKYRR